MIFKNENFHEITQNHIWKHFYMNMVILGHQVAGEKIRKLLVSFFLLVVWTWDDVRSKGLCFRINRQFFLWWLDLKKIFYGHLKSKHFRKTALFATILTTLNSLGREYQNVKTTNELLVQLKKLFEWHKCVAISLSAFSRCQRIC